MFLVNYDDDGDRGQGDDNAEENEPAAVPPQASSPFSRRRARFSTPPGVPPTAILRLPQERSE